jgi:hypothetical protein
VGEWVARPAVADQASVSVWVKFGVTVMLDSVDGAAQ